MNMYTQPVYYPLFYFSPDYSILFHISLLQENRLLTLNYIL